MTNHTEGTIQAELYHQCRLIGLKVACEFTTAVGRLDVAVFSPAGDLVAAVEVKKMKPFYETAQVKRYKTLGIPVYDVWQYEACADLAKSLASVEHPGITVDFAKSAYLPEGHQLKRRSTSRAARAYEALRRNLL